MRFQCFEVESGALIALMRTYSASLFLSDIPTSTLPSIDLVSDRFPPWSDIYCTVPGKLSNPVLGSQAKILRVDPGHITVGTGRVTRNVGEKSPTTAAPKAPQLPRESSRSFENCALPEESEGKPSH